MVKSVGSSALLPKSARQNDSTRGSEGYSMVLRYEYGDASLEDDIRALVWDVKLFFCRHLLRFLVLAVCFCLFFSLFRSIVYVVDVYYFDDKSERFLDRIHDPISDKHLPFLSKFCDAVFYPFFALVALRFLLFYPPVFNVHILIRFFVLYVFMFPLRASFVLFTSIPSPYPFCTQYVKDTGWRSFLSILYRKDDVACSGTLFSGHAHSLALCFIIIAQNSDFLQTIFMFVYAAVVAVATVATKYHYSIDVMFALLFSVFTYYLYFTRIDTYGVLCYNRINMTQSTGDERLMPPLLETSFINRWFAWFEQIGTLIQLGFRMKELQHMVAGNSAVDATLVRKLNLCIYLFGLRDCDDVLTLYRGGGMFNFSYWDQIKRKFRSKKSNRNRL